MGRSPRIDVDGPGEDTARVDPRAGNHDGAIGFPHLYVIFFLKLHPDTRFGWRVAMEITLARSQLGRASKR